MKELEKYIKCVLLVLVISLPFSSAVGQFSDDFSGGDLLAWSGDVEDFMISPQEELQLNAQSDGPSFLYVQNPIARDALWEIQTRMTFAPSNSNALEWLLQSSTPNLNEWSGYGLRWGESGDSDAVELVRYDNGSLLVLGRMREGAVASDPVQIRIQVQRVVDTFTVYAAYDGETMFSDSLIVIDDTYAGGAQLVSGVLCHFTSTRSDRFFFDDVIIDRSRPDLSPPVRRDVLPQANAINIAYSEPIDISQLQASLEPGNFQIDPILKGVDTLQLLLSPELTPLTEYNLRLEGITDQSGNMTPVEEIPITYIDTRPPEPFEVIINELMIAPGGETALPEKEYIELFNRTDDYLELGELFLLDESSAGPLPNFTLSPGGYVILCSSGDRSLFEAYGEVLEVNGLPTLRNSGDNIRLRDSENRFIHGVDYTDNWYKDSNKDRGWSLELVDPNLACSGEIAFAASTGPLGGTPGQMNSLPALVTDSLTPILAEVNDNAIVEIQFNQWLPSDVLQPEMVSVESGEGAVENLWVDMENPRNLQLELDESIKAGQLYSLEIESSFLNCLQEPLGASRFIQWGLPATPAAGDLLISEVMFNPNVGESQWVEVYNASDSIFDFTYIVLDVFKETGQDRLTVGLPNQILPGEYFVFTDNANEVNEMYSAPFPKQTLEVDFPSLDRDTGRLRLSHVFGAEATILDSNCYNSDWHSGFLRSERGVSLERTRWDLSACDASNWQSAAESEGYGTPTGSNSQQLSLPEGYSDGFQLISPTFSPNSDGQEDFARVEYNHSDSDRILPRIQFSVFRPDGQLIKRVYNNYGLSRRAQLLWDGSQRDGLIAPEGFYLLRITVFDDAGRTDVWKGTIYLVR